MVFSGRSQTHLRVTRSPSILGYFSLCGRRASEAEQPSGCEIYRSREEESSGGKNELPADGEQKKETKEKTTKYGPLRWKLKQLFPGYDVWDYNIDVLFKRMVHRRRRGYEGTVRGSRRRDSSSDTDSRHLAHPEHYPYTESDILRIADTFLVILFIIHYTLH